MDKNQFFAVQVITEDDIKLLAWEEDKHFYFAEKSEGFDDPPTPALFNSKEEAEGALDEIPEEDGNLEQFLKVVEAKSYEVVKVNISVE